MKDGRRPLLVAVAATALVALVALVALALTRSGDDDTTSTTPITATGAVDATTTASATSTVTPATSAVPTTSAARTTSTTAAAVTSTEAAAATTTTAAATTTSPETTAATEVPAATTTTPLDPDAVPAFPCDAKRLLAAFAAGQEIPQGTQLTEVKCYGVYAAGVLSAQGQNLAFVVFGAGETDWRLLNVGTAFVCQPLEITDPAYTTIGCPKWDT